MSIRITGAGARHAAAMFAVVACCAAVSARVSEPHNIYYGHALDADGHALELTKNAKIVARVNARVAATYDVIGVLKPGVNYVLSVPLDDGVDYRYAAYAARAGEVPELTIVYDDQELPVDADVPAAGPRGTLHELDVVAVPEPLGAVLSLAGLGWYCRCRRAARL